MIKGKLVGLRSIEQVDLVHLKEWRNNPDFRINFREHRELNDVNQCNWFDAINKNQNDYMFAIVRLEDSKLIGACGLLYINWINRSADFSYYLGLDNLYIDNLGYSAESISLLIDYGFNYLNLNKIWMELYEFDSKKIEIFQNQFHFKIDGKLRQNCYHNGKYYDSYIISLLKQDI
jgi:RimJ/RimL family protein N-acetyltransferase